MIAQSITVPLSSRSCLLQSAEKVNRDISVNRQVRTSVFVLEPSYTDGSKALVTCDLTKPRPLHLKTLQMEFGLQDSETRSAFIYVYLDGNLAATERITRGSTKKVSLNIQGVRSVAIEAEALGSVFGFSPTPYVVEAFLKP